MLLIVGVRTRCLTFPGLCACGYGGPVCFLARKLKVAENVHLNIIKFSVIFPVDLVKGGLELCVSNNL